MLKKSIQTYYQSFISLFYPNLCLICNGNVPFTDRQICLKCETELPVTNFHLDDDNPIFQKFAGRIKLEQAAAFFYFFKKGKVQTLIHDLKYHNKADVGVQLGKMYGSILKESGYFDTIDFILPVPLHPKKEKQRGYNQSDMFAQGLSAILDKPWRNDILKRIEYTNTQTQKSTIERFENVKSAFKIAKPDVIQNKHVLIVDDVLTTGATMEACAINCLEIGDCRVSFAVIGYAVS
jgi:ComF family protein